MELRYKICNLTPIDIEILQNTRCYTTKTDNIPEANFLYTDIFVLIHALNKKYSCNKIREILGYDKSHLNKKATKMGLIQDLIFTIEDLETWLGSNN